VGELLDKIKPLSPGQEEMKAALSDKSYDVIGFFGPTGTGKSLFSLAYGIDSVISGEYKRFIVAKPVIDVVTGEEITITKAPEAFMQVVMEYVNDVIGMFIERSKIEELMKDGKLVFVDPHYLRGRTFDEAVIFIDEVQTIPAEGFIEMIIRVGRDCRLIVAGDPIFQRLRNVEHDPSALIRDVLVSEERAKVVDLGIKDIVREGAKRGLRLLFEYKMRSRELSEEEKKAYDVLKAHSPDADIITILDITEDKERYEIAPEHVPDLLVVVKQGHLGRLVGRGGERISAAERELNKRIRGVELNLNFKDIIRAIHPTSWIWRHIVEADFAGPNLQVKIYEDIMGPMVGQRGMYIRFLDSVFRKLIGVGVRVVPIEERRKRRRS